MLSGFFYELNEAAIPIIPVVESQLASWINSQDSRCRNYLQTTHFKGKAGSFSLLPDAEGKLHQVVVGIHSKKELNVFGQLASTLPAGDYYVDTTGWDDNERYHLFLAWGMGSYQFTPYKKLSPLSTRLYLPELGVNQTYLTAVLKATYWVRDLINTPADDMMPADLGEAASRLAEEFNAEVTQIIGDDLLQHRFAAIHTVGRGSEHEPRLIDLRWGEKQNPKVTLVGKGVCFDSGGLNLKASNQMATMKKDMGGAAHVLGLARVLMSMNLPICLRVLIPAVENAVSGRAYHPGDVIMTRKGLTIEITNTDAEGRLVLADALFEAAQEHPEILIDFSTLTGAARVALGTEVGAYFTPDAGLAEEVQKAADKEKDPVWRLPLYAPYRKLMESKIADLVNASSSPYGGAITAAVFLQEFIDSGIPWCHFDIMAWNTTNKPGMPEGGEANGLRAVARYLCERYAQK